MNDTQKTKWKNLGKKIGGLLPGVAALLGGPAVGAGAKILIDHFGSDDPDAIEARIEGMDHGQILELKKLDAQTRQKELDAEMNAEDNLTARLVSDNATDSPFVKYTRPGIAWAWTVLVVLVVVPSGLWWVDPVRVDIYKIVAYLCFGILFGIYGFYFGSRGFEKMSAIISNRFGTNPADKLASIFRKK